MQERATHGAVAEAHKLYNFYICKDLLRVVSAITMNTTFGGLHYARTTRTDKAWVCAALMPYG